MSAHLQCILVTLSVFAVQFSECVVAKDDHESLESLGRSNDEIRHFRHRTVANMETASNQIKAAMHELRFRLGHIEEVFEATTTTTTTTTTTPTETTTTTATTTTATAPCVCLRENQGTADTCPLAPEEPFGRGESCTCDFECATEPTALLCASDCMRENSPVNEANVCVLASGDASRGDNCFCDSECPEGLCSTECIVVLPNGGTSQLVDRCILSTASVPANSACVCTSECLQGLLCIGDDDMLATPRNCGLPIGADCSADDDMCISGSSCVLGTCILNGQLRGACFTSDDCSQSPDAMTCENGRCVLPLGPSSQVCSSRFDCPSGQLCSSGNCLLPTGANCGIDIDGDGTLDNDVLCVAGCDASLLTCDPTNAPQNQDCGREEYTVNPADQVECSDLTTTCANSGLGAAPVDPSGSLKCLLRDGQSCNQDNECASGRCDTICLVTPYTQELRQQSGFPASVPDDCTGANTCVGAALCVGNTCQFTLPGNDCSGNEGSFEVCSMRDFELMTDLASAACSPTGLCPEPCDCTRLRSDALSAEVYLPLDECPAADAFALGTQCLCDTQCASGLGQNCVCDFECNSDECSIDCTLDRGEMAATEPNVCIETAGSVAPGNSCRCDSECASGFVCDSTSTNCECDCKRAGVKLVPEPVPCPDPNSPPLDLSLESACMCDSDCGTDLVCDPDRAICVIAVGTTSIDCNDRSECPSGTLCNPDTLNCLLLTGGSCADEIGMPNHDVCLADCISVSGSLVCDKSRGLLNDPCGIEEYHPVSNSIECLGASFACVNSGIAQAGETGVYDPLAPLLCLKRDGLICTSNTECASGACRSGFCAVTPYTHRLKQHSTGSTTDYCSSGPSSSSIDCLPGVSCVGNECDFPMPNESCATDSSLFECSMLGFHLSDLESAACGAVTSLLCPAPCGCTRQGSEVILPLAECPASGSAPTGTPCLCDHECSATCSAASMLCL
ncbi:MAG: hypothetical protein MHM6MM_004346 [Cercozoa sp. M6MM]